MTSDCFIACCIAVFREAGERMGIPPEDLARIVLGYRLDELLNDAFACRCFEHKSTDAARRVCAKRDKLFADVEAAAEREGVGA